MSRLEISILIAASAVVLSANLIATLRAARRLGRYSIAYVILIWCVPVIGALFVLAKIRPRSATSLLPINPNTLSNPSTTMRTQSWPTTVSAPPTRTHH